MAQRPSAPQPPRAEPDLVSEAVATLHWIKAFLAALADTSNVAAAARAAGIDASTAYNRRRHDNEFNRQWQVALCEGYDNLELELLYRLRTGELKPPSGAKRAARSFDNATAFRLLAAHRESAARERARQDHVSAEEIRAAIDRKVEELRQRVMDAKAQREAAALAAGILPKPRDPA
jgi:transcriptional antiterminator Rof (Rho-off)